MHKRQDTQRSYIATFPAGCFAIISRQLKRFGIDELEIRAHDDSSVSFASTLRPERLIELRFFTNIFLVIDPDQPNELLPFIKGKTFRLMALKEGEPVTLTTHTRKTLAARLHAVFAQKGTGRYVHDVVLIKRKGAPETLTLRLPRPKHKRADLPAGALRPELAHILLLVAGVKPKDVLLDPFAGYGSIPAEARAGFGLTHVHAVEKDPVLANLYHAQAGDATDLIHITNHSITKIVTDPPWGQFQPVDHKLYELALQEMRRILSPKGVIVILSGNQALNKQLEEEKHFRIIQRHDILVSGKKATIFKLQK